MENPIITLEDGWAQLRRGGIDRIEEYINDSSNHIDYINSSSSSSSTKVIDENKNACVISNREYANMYTIVYTMGTQRPPHNYSKELYQRYGEAITQYVKQQVVPQVLKKRGKMLMAEMLLRWENHKFYVKWMHRFFSYLDRYYVKLHGQVPLYTKGISIFKEEVFERVKSHLSVAVLDAITMDREGYPIDADLIHSLVEMYISLGGDTLCLYQKHLEDFILPETQIYYDKQVTEWMETLTFSEYLVNVEKSLIAEAQRCERYLDISTSSRMELVIIHSLLGTKYKSLLEKDTAIVYLLEQGAVKELTAAYNLFSLFEPGIESITQIFKNYIIHKGNTLIKEHLEISAAGPTPKSALTISIDDYNFVNKVLDLHNHFKTLVSDCFVKVGRDGNEIVIRQEEDVENTAHASQSVCVFSVNDFLRDSQKTQSDAGFQKALKEAFEAFINSPEIQPAFPQLLAGFCDRALRGFEDDTLLENTLLRVVEVFNYVTEKDIFAGHYRSLLARRLLNESSRSLELEKGLVSRLKLKCGAHFTCKFEGMIADLSTSASLQTHFAEDYTLTHKECNPLVYDSQGVPCLNIEGIEFSVQALSATHWPSYPTTPLQLPSSLSNCLTTFEEFYSRKTKHRKLSWVHCLGSALVAGYFNKRYDIMCSTNQAALLLCFNSASNSIENDSEKICTLSDISTALGMDEASTEKMLNSCALGKFKLLNKNPDETFQVNTNFSSQNRKIKLPTPIQEEAQNKARVDEDRSITIDAAIVRVMKTRKSLQHQQLIAEVLNQLNFFKPSPKQVKERIQDLLAREFLDRDKDDPTLYNYLA